MGSVKISFVCLFPGAGTKMLKMKCLVTNLSGKALSFSPLSMILAEGLLLIVFTEWGKISSIFSLLRFFCHEWVLDFVKCPFLRLLIRSDVFLS